MRILVSPEHLDQVAQEFHQAGDTTKQLIAQLSQSMGRLEMGWNGTTQANFFTMFQEAHYHLNAASENMLSTHHELAEIAKRFRAADQAENETPTQEVTHTVPNSSHPVGPFQARFGMDPDKLGPPAPWVKSTLNFFFGTTDIANEVNTLQSNASTGTKFVAGAGLVGNALLDASYIFGIGEVAKGVQILGKSVRLLRKGIRLPSVVIRGGTVFKVVNSVDNLTRIDRILQEMRQYKAEWIKAGDPAVEGSGEVAKGTVEAETISSALSKSGYDSAQIKQVEEAFGPGAAVVTLKQDLRVYRYYGGGAGARGRWVTTSMLKDPVNELALPPGSTAIKVAEWVIPKGTQVIKGTVAPNFGRPGGALQIFLPDSSVLLGR